jgi:nucleoid-associated protein YgaU
MFQSDAQTAFDEAAAPFAGSLPLIAPTAVREVVVERGEILERIAQREYGDAARWVDIVVLNNLKPPYIDTVRRDGVKIPGDKLLIGVD